MLIKPETDDLYWLEVWVKNDRVYPTASDRSVKLERAVKDKLTIHSSDNIEIINLMEDVTIFDPLDNSSTYQSITGKDTEFRLKGKETLKFRGLVKMNGSNGWIEPFVESKMGGKHSKKITIKVGS